MPAPRRRRASSQAENEQKVWDFFNDSSTHDFFRDITISPDGGFSEVLELWRPSRWFTALVTVLFLLMNLYYTCLIDIMLILKDGSDTGMMLISRGFFQWLCNAVMNALGRPHYIIKADKWIAIVELLLTSQMLIVLVYCGVKAMTSKRPKDKWFNAEKVWWREIPNLYSYSAMRLLHYVSPQVLPIHFARFPTFTCCHKIRFVLMRTMCLIIGFDAFMLKCRESREFITTADAGIASMWAGFVFLRQVLGIVQVNFEVQDRVFSFMFAGEDGVMQDEERFKKKVWKAMLISEIFKQFRQQFGHGLGTAKSVALMLSFDDTDFQKLFLDQRPNQKHVLPQDSSSGSEEDGDNSGDSPSSGEDNA